MTRFGADTVRAEIAVVRGFTAEAAETRAAREVVEVTFESRLTRSPVCAVVRVETRGLSAGRFTDSAPVRRDRSGVDVAESDAVEAPAEPVSSARAVPAPRLVATAAPTPRATASAPIRPTCRAYPAPLDGIWSAAG